MMRGRVHTDADARRPTVVRHSRDSTSNKTSYVRERERFRVRVGALERQIDLLIHNQNLHARNGFVCVSLGMCQRERVRQRACCVQQNMNVTTKRETQ